MSLIAEFLTPRRLKGRPTAWPSVVVSFNGLLWTASLIILMLHCACIYDKVLMHSPNGIQIVDNMCYII
jgi:hypothetical protein